MREDILGGFVSKPGSEIEESSSQGDDERLKIKNSIIRALVRREHSRYELKSKMRLKLYDEALIDAVLDQLESDALVSDERFAEAYCYHRKSRGFGPLRISSELKERQISEKLIAEYVDLAEDDWFCSALTQREKKFGNGKVRDFAQKAKQMRFLQNKGFTHEQISHAMESVI